MSRNSSKCTNQCSSSSRKDPIIKSNNFIKWIKSSNTINLCYWNNYLFGGIHVKACLFYALKYNYNPLKISRSGLDSWYKGLGISFNLSNYGKNECSIFLAFNGP
jgi:hypothetical protein